MSETTVGGYYVLVEHTSGYYCASCPELGAIAVGTTEAECLSRMEEAIALRRADEGIL